MAEPALETDVASAQSIGRRNSQEDAVATDFPIGAGHGFVALADGMGGHGAGDVASQIVVTEVFRTLKRQCAKLSGAPGEIPRLLSHAARNANRGLRHQVERAPATRGMGATLVALFQRGASLNWVSVGDSVLYLYRDGDLRRLNADHSLAPQIDLMISKGLLSEKIGSTHSFRNCLTSALTGGTIATIDCPAEPLGLTRGDIVLVASDGLQVLSDRKIADILRESRDLASQEIARLLIDAVADLDDPDQDNVSLSVLKLSGPRTRKQPNAASPPKPTARRLPVFASFRRLSLNPLR